MTSGSILIYNDVWVYETLNMLYLHFYYYYSMTLDDQLFQV